MEDLKNIKEVLDPYYEKKFQKILNEELHSENEKHFKKSHRIGLSYSIGLGFCIGFLVAVITYYIFIN